MNDDYVGRYSFYNKNATSAGCIWIYNIQDHPSYFDEMKIATDLEVSLSPAISGQIIKLVFGIWTGEVSLQTQASEIFLIVQDGPIAKGISNVFNITDGILSYVSS